jgi:hypothetical protein
MWLTKENKKQLKNVWMEDQNERHLLGKLGVYGQII